MVVYVFGVMCVLYMGWQAIRGGRMLAEFMQDQTGLHFGHAERMMWHAWYDVLDSAAREDAETFVGCVGQMLIRFPMVSSFWFVLIHT